MTHAILPWSLSLRRDDGVCLIHGVRERRRGIAHGAIGHDHLLWVRELRIELGRVGHESRGIHHDPGDSRRVVNMREAVAIVVRDCGGLVDPGAHVGRKVRQTKAMAGPIRLIPLRCRQRPSEVKRYSLSRSRLIKSGWVVTRQRLVAMRSSRVAV